MASKRDNKTPSTVSVQDFLLGSKSDQLDHLYLNNIFAALYILQGAGKRGKTSVARMFVEGAAMMGRPMSTADLEEMNPGLSAVIPECIVPKTPIADGAQLGEFLFPLIEGIAASGRSLLVDFEGNDRRPIEMADQAPVLELMELYNVPLIVIAVVAGGTDDLVGIDALGEALKGPADALIIVINDIALPHQFQHRETYEEHISKHPGVKILGGKRVDFVWLPRCPLMRLMDGKDLRFETIATDHTRAGINAWQAGFLSRHFAKVMESMQRVLPCKG